MKYQVTIEGRVFEGQDPRVLLRKAVAAKRRLSTHRRCRRCRRVIEDSYLSRYRLCFECVNQAVVWYTDELVARFKPQTQRVEA